MKKFLPFGISAAKYGIVHRWLGWQRRLTSQSFTKHFDELKAKRSDIEVVCDDNGSPVSCSICGYVLIRTEPEPGWFALGCSATTMKTFVRAQVGGGWQPNLDKCANVPQSHLQTAEH